MRMQWRYLIGGTGVAALSFVLGLGVETEIATARTGSDLTPAGPAAFGQTVFNRSLKGDRIAPRLRPSVAPAQPQKLLDGCEASHSMIGSSRQSAIPGRCIA
jgi:hypothetical protein